MPESIGLCAEFFSDGPAFTALTFSRLCTL